MLAVGPAGLEEHALILFVRELDGRWRDELMAEGSVGVWVGRVVGVGRFVVRRVVVVADIVGHGADQRSATRRDGEGREKEEGR